MNFELLITFVILNIFNVIIQTVKSIATIKCGKILAAVANAVAYGLYTIVVVYMLCDLPLLWKAGIVALCNLIGVFVVKFIEERVQKDKLWKIEVTIPAAQCQRLLDYIESSEKVYSFNYIDIEKYSVFNFYCPTQQDTCAVKKLLDIFDAKYFASESIL